MANCRFMDTAGKDRVARVRGRLRDPGGPGPDGDYTRAVMLVYEMAVIESTRPGACAGLPSLRENCSICFRLLAARPPEVSRAHG